MVGQINLKGCDGHIAVAGGEKISTLACLLGRPGTTNPVHDLTARAGLGDDPLSRMTAPQARHLHALDLVVGQIGNIHVEQPGRKRRLRAVRHSLKRWNELTHQLAGAPGRHIDMGPALFGLRKGNGGDAEKIALHGRTDSARVNRVVAHVGAIVDA